MGPMTEKDEAGPPTKAGSLRLISGKTLSSCTEPGRSGWLVIVMMASFNQINEIKPWKGKHCKKMMIQTQRDQCNYDHSLQPPLSNAPQIHWVCLCWNTFILREQLWNCQGLSPQISELSHEVQSLSWKDIACTGNGHILGIAGQVAMRTSLEDVPKSLHSTDTSPTRHKIC